MFSVIYFGVGAALPRIPLHTSRRTIALIIAGYSDISIVLLLTDLWIFCY